MPLRIHHALGSCVISAVLVSPLWCADPIATPRIAGWDGWRGDLHAYYEAHWGGKGSDGSDPADAVAGWAVTQWHLFHLEARIGLQAQAEESALYHQNPYSSRMVRSYIQFTEAGLRYAFDGPGGGGDIQLGFFRPHPGTGPDLFGNYILRSEPYPGRMPLENPAADTLGSTADPDLGLRIAYGAEGGPLRAEAMVLESPGVIGDYSWFGFLEGTLPRGLQWSVSAGLRHAFGLTRNHNFYSELVWARGKTGVVPIDSARSAEENGAAFSDSGGITQRALVLSARLEWLQSFSAAGPGGAFGEAALLGWANQPLLYEDRWRRLAVTVGLRPPTWGLLQLCLLQLEWRPGAYHPVGFTYAPYERGYFEPADVASPWSYAALLGRDIGRHWALRGRFAYAPQVWTDAWYNPGWGFEPIFERIKPDIHRGKGQVSLQVRAEFRFGSLL